MFIVVKVLYMVFFNMWCLWVYQEISLYKYNGIIISLIIIFVIDNKIKK